jgi:site-specific recombinase XerD
LLKRFAAAVATSREGYHSPAPSVFIISLNGSARPLECCSTCIRNMLRHACGYKLANDGHDTRALQHYLGHRNIQHTVRYTELAPDRFRDFWR